MVLHAPEGGVPDNIPEGYPLHPEDDRRDPQVVALLGSAGLTAVDLQLFDRIHQMNHHVFVHGSIMANRITDTSDIDFTIVGRSVDLSAELHEALMPGLDAAQLVRPIDYTSTSVRSQAGRKVSMHISEPDFRYAYPILHAPFATEYRPGMHAKNGPRNYFLSGTDVEGNPRLVNFTCESTPAGTDGGMITDIPQTGKLILKGDTVIVDGKVKADVVASHVIRLWADGEPDDKTPADAAEEIMILGLEYDKMQSDTSMYDDPTAADRFVKDPALRSMKAIGEFTKIDPAAITGRLFGELAKHWHQIKPNKQR